MARVWPRAARTVEAVRLIHRQQRLRAFERDALLTQRPRGRPQGTPTAGGGVVWGKHGRAIQLADGCVKCRGDNGWMLAHDCVLNFPSHGYVQ